LEHLDFTKRYTREAVFFDCGADALSYHDVFKAASKRKIGN
jgi:hypothetical protein